MEPKRPQCSQNEAKGIKSEPKGEQTNKKNDLQKRLVQGCQREFEVLGPERLCQLGSKHRCPNHPKSTLKQVPKQIMKIIQNHSCGYVKAKKFIVKTMFFDDLEGCVHERNSY